MSKCSLIAVSALLLTSTLAMAADKYGKPLESRPATQSAPSSQPERTDGWRERALRSRAQDPEAFPPQRGNSRAVDERGERMDGEEAGSGGLRQDQGEGGE